MSDVKGISETDKPNFVYEGLTWGDESDALIANSALMKVESAGPERVAAALQTMERLLCNTVIDIPAKWVTPAALRDGVNWSEPGAFRKYLKFGIFKDLNQAFFDGLRAGEKK